MLRALCPVALFSRIVVVDWSAAGVPARGANSLWWAAARVGTGRAGRAHNPPTRARAVAELARGLTAALARGERVLVGFDFALGYPAGTARALGLQGVPWRATWALLARELSDGEDNRNDRLALAARLNRRLGPGPGPFWGLPRGARVPGLTATRPFAFPCKGLSEGRTCERALPGAQSVWRLAYPGAVGGQTLTGLEHLVALRAAFPEARVWPLETGWRAPPREARVVLCEVFPSLLGPAPPGRGVKDAWQVRALARHLARSDADGRLAQAFLPPAGVPARVRRAVEREEGWVLHA